MRICSTDHIVERNAGSNTLHLNNNARIKTTLVFIIPAQNDEKRHVLKC